MRASDESEYMFPPITNTARIRKGTDTPELCGIKTSRAPLSSTFILAQKISGVPFGVDFLEETNNYQRGLRNAVADRRLVDPNLVRESSGHSFLTNRGQRRRRGTSSPLLSGALRSLNGGFSVKTRPRHGHRTRLPRDSSRRDVQILPNAVPLAFARSSRDAFQVTFKSKEHRLLLVAS